MKGKKSVTIKWNVVEVSRLLPMFFIGIFIEQFGLRYGNPNCVLLGIALWITFLIVAIELLVLELVNPIFLCIKQMLKKEKQIFIQIRLSIAKSYLNILIKYISQLYIIHHSKDEKDLTQEQKDFIENINKYIKKYNEQYANNFRKNNKKNLIKYMQEYNLLKTQKNKENELLELDEKINKLFKKRMNLQAEISKENGLLSYNFLNYYFAHCLNTEDNPYKTLPIPTAQQVLRYLEQNWINTFKSIKKYAKNPSNYTGKPKLPKYKKKNGRIKIAFTYQQCKIKDGYLTFPKTDLTIKLGFDCSDLSLKEVHIVPMGVNYKIEIVWNKKKSKENHNLDKNAYMGIDLGVSNFATLTNNIELNPIIINGRQLKSMNQYYNKKKQNYNLNYHFTKQMMIQ